MRDTRAWIAVLGLLAGCFSANRPLDSTKTGNPPVIDSDRVALKVGSDEVHVIGEPGAIMPGGATVEVTNLSSGDVQQTMSASDGSFDLRVDGSANDAFSVRARDDDEVSVAVYVVRGSAAVSLSCDQRNTLAGDLLHRAADGADRACSSDADCAAVLPQASCYTQCEYAYVSAAGRSEIEQAERDVAAGLCANYTKDGCSVAVLDCATPTAPLCLMGRCGSFSRTPPDVPPSCNQLELVAGRRHSEALDAADKSCTSDADCEVASSLVTCRDDCAFESPVASRGRAAFDAAIADINAEECASFAAMGCMAPAPARECPDSGWLVVCVQSQCTLAGSQ